MRKMEKSPEGEAAEALPSGSGAKRVAMAVEERDVAKEVEAMAREDMEVEVEDMRPGCTTCERDMHRTEREDLYV